MNSRYRLPLFILALAALVAAFAIAPLQAQEGTEYDYVDLVMLYRQDPEGSGNAHQVAYSVLNSGTATATGVTVSFELEDLQAGEFEGSFFAGSRTIPIITNKKTVNTTDQTFTWEIGTILPGETSHQLIFNTQLHEGHTTANRIGVITATAKALQPEPGILSANNVIKIYSYATRTGTTTTLHMKGNKLALLLSVDDLEPAAGDDLNFDLTARNFNDSEHGASNFINLIGDIEIKVELSAGLQFKTGWSPTGVTVASDRQSATWTPDATDARDDVSPQIRPNSRELEIETQLTSDSLDDIPLEERCITAWVADSIPPPSDDYVLGSFTQCLGDDPTVLFEEGELDLFTLYPCVGVSPIAYPCRDDDDDSTVDNGLELVAQSDITSQFAPRAHGVVRRDDGNAVYLRPESVLVRADPEARVGTKWYTGSDENSDSNDAGQIPGALVHLDFLGADWKPYTFAIADVSPKKRPGSMAIPRMDNTGFTILDADTQTSLGPADFALDVIPLVVVFGTLGTHQVDLTMGGNSGGTAYTSTGTYTFHVGPVAELEVRDGGERPDLGTDQRAYTIVAVNNGPDDASAAEVTVTGLDATTCTGTATKGSLAFASGECTWTIGELITKESSQGRNLRDGEILTIITTAVVDSEITAEIENTQDYQVCIDSDGDDVELSSPSSSACTTEDATNTWHTAKYYDYNDDNDSATIKAKDGTGADLPSLRSAQEDTASIIVEWDAIDEVSGRGVTHYEVQRETNPWETVADDVTGTEYVDTDVEVGDTFRYRVRAVNDWDHKGPWSQPIEGSVAEMDTQVRTVTRTIEPEIEPPGRPTGMQAMPIGAAELLVFWSTPAGSIVDHYELQVSEDGGSTWDDLDDNLMANSYNHTGLQEGDTRHYRVRAWNTDDPQEEGPWSATVGATTSDSSVTAQPPPQVITPSRSRDDDDDDYAHFATLTTTRSVVENSAAGSPVGNRWWPPPIGATGSPTPWRATTPSISTSSLTPGKSWWARTLSWTTRAARTATPWWWWPNPVGAVPTG